jgi:RHS repeat-associated protein
MASKRHEVRRRASEEWRRYGSVIAVAFVSVGVTGCTKSSSEHLSKQSERLEVTAGLVAAYDFEEGSGSTAADISGNGNLGTLSGAAWTSGKNGGALSYDGVDDRVVVPDSASLDLTDGMTLMAWVKPDALDGWETVVLKEHEVEGLSYGLVAADGADAPPAGYAPMGGIAESIVGSSLLPLDQWSHIAVTFDEMAFRLFVDGFATSRQAPTGEMVAGTAPLSIGGEAAAEEWFDGVIDEVRIYDRALSKSEVRLEAGLPPVGLVAAYAFDDGTGSTTQDASGHGNPGTISGASWTAAGKHGGALSFDGVDDIVSVADATSLDLDDGMTLMAWVRPLSLSDWRTILLKEWGGGLSYGLYAAGDGPPSIWTTIFEGPASAHAPSSLPLDTWSHVSATYDGSSLSLYVNASLVASETSAGLITHVDDQLSIGGNLVWGEYFEGTIDDVRVYAKPLSQSEIEADMNAPVTEGCEGAGICDDTNPCNGLETCSPAGCVPGTPPSVDDGNPCTADACDPVAGVTHTPVAAGTSCSNGDACDGAEVCDAAGSCVEGTPVTCSSSDQCHDVGTCNPATGVCSNPAKADGSSCSDGDACTQTDTCQTGACVGGNPVTCAASDQCHDAGTCNPATGVCSNPAKPDGTACPDGTVCNGAETCSSGTCASGTPLVLDDGNPCTADACNPVAGVSHTPVTAGTSCTDFDFCNGSELCDAAGICQSGTPVSTEDGNECTSGSCDPLTGVVTQTPLPTGTECFIDVCTLGECNATGECTGAGSTIVDDGDPCTVEWCDPVLGPQMKACSPIDRTVGTTLHESMRWIFSGTNPPQVGVAPGTIEVQRATAFRGVLKTRDGSALPGVTVTILDHPEYGHTLTHADGYFDLVVNGGGVLVLAFEKEGYVTVHRSVESVWGDHAVAPEVVMVPLDPVVTPIDLVAPAEDFQVAQGSVQTDEDGSRQGTLLVPAGTEATAYLEGGGTVELDSMSVRITEFTVGPNGPNAMPAPLPADSKYTYAFEASVDGFEGATTVEFSTPLPYYVDNFLQFPAGTPIPLGYFDRVTSTWKADENGVALDILGEAGGFAQIDVTGDGVEDTGAALAAYGITDTERAKLADLYEPGQSLWRVLIRHFTPWDCNMGGVPENATPPNQPPPKADDEPKCESEVPFASTIQCDSQVLRESIPIAGTPYSLNYSSSRVLGRKAAYQVKIPLSGETIPFGLWRIDLEVSVAGRVFRETFPPLPNQTKLFVWDGLDAYGRRPQGAQPYSSKIDFVYELRYSKNCCDGKFGYSGNGTAITVNPARTEASFPQIARTRVGIFEASALGLGGWTIDGNHFHELGVQRLQLGDGTDIDDSSLPAIVRETMNGPTSSTREIVVTPEGSMFGASGTAVWRASPGITPALFAGSDFGGYGGDGLPADDPSVRFRTVTDLALGRDGSLYVADMDNHIVRRVGADDGIIETIAGVPQVQGSDVGVDGMPATDHPIAFPRHLAIGPDGSVYISEIRGVRRVSPEGTINRIAGDWTLQTGAFLPEDGSIATDVHIVPGAVAVSPDGILHLALNTCTPAFICGLNRIVRIVDGRMYHVAGNLCDGAQLPCDPRDGLPAKLTTLSPGAMAFDANGQLFFVEAFGSRVRTVTPDGAVATVASSENAPPFAEGAAATSVNLLSQDVAFGPDGLYVSGGFGQKQVFRVARPLPSETGNSFFVGARNDDAFYAFDSLGRHHSTTHSLTGSGLRQFSYTAGGRLSTITDESGLVTQIERNAFGSPIAIIAPFGQRTELELDGNGYLAEVTDPHGQITAMTYTPDGLMTSFENARGHTSVIEWDALGRLELDEDPAGGSHTLTRSESADGSEWTIDRTTALGRTTTYTTTKSTTGVDEKMVIMPSGEISSVLTTPEQVFVALQADGTSVTTRENSDQRFGLNSPLVSRTVTTPSGLTSTEITTRSYGALNPDNLLEFFTRTDVTTRNGRSWTRDFHRTSRTFTTTSPQSRQTFRTIDVHGRTTRTQVAGLLPVDFSYDSSGRLDQVTQGTRTTQNAYFPTGPSAGYLSSITDATSVATTFTRDALGRMLTETRSTATTAFGWDPMSNLASVTPPGKPTHEINYAPVNLVEAYEPPAAGLPASATSYAYDLDRMLRTETRPNSVTIIRTPDSAGRLDTVAFPGGLVDYDYVASNAPSGAGKVSSMAGPYGVDLAFTYDGMLTTSTSWSGSVTGSVAWQYNSDFQKLVETVSGAAGSATTAFAYDNDMLLTCASPSTCSPPGADALILTRHPQHGMVTNLSLGATSEAWSYNGFGELARQVASFSGSPLVDITYDEAGFERDALGRIIRKTETILGVTKVYEYRYDALRRLDQVKVDGVVDEEFTYDANGNRLTAFKAGQGTVSATYDDQDRLLTYGTWTFTYTANGELESKTNTATSETWMFQYDALGNLVTAGLPNGDLVEYLVDGMGRRVGKTKNGVLLKRWIYRDALKPVAELDGVGNLVAQFAYAAEGKLPDYVVRSGATYRVVSDHLGSPRYVVNVANSTDVPFTADHRSFGEVTGAGLDWMPFGFAGGHFDPDTRLVRFGARDYDPMVGRWTRKDPALFDGLSTNLYSYALSDALNIWDDTGEAPNTDPNGLSRLCATQGAPCAPYHNHPSTPGQIGALYHCRKTKTGFLPGASVKFTCSYKYPNGDQCTFFNNSGIGICNSFLPNACGGE